VLREAGSVLLRYGALAEAITGLSKKTLVRVVHQRLPKTRTPTSCAGSSGRVQAFDASEHRPERLELVCRYWASGPIGSLIPSQLHPNTSVLACRSPGQSLNLSDG
jgi:hypothetical protein